MKSMYEFDCGSTGAPEISWFHQLLEGKRARPPKSSDSRTVLLGGVEVGGGAGAFGEGAAGDCGGCASDAGVESEGAIGVAGSLPQADVTRHKTTIKHTAARAVERRMMGVASNAHTSQKCRGLPHDLNSPARNE